MKKGPIQRPELCAGVLGLALSVALFWATFSLPEFPVRFAGPAFYPRVLAIALAFISLAMVWQASAGAAPAADTAEAAGEPRRGSLVLMAIVASVLYYAGIEPFGFVVMTVLYFAFLMFLMQPRKKVLKTLLWAGGTTFAIYLIFAMLLRASLPMGTIFR